MIQACPHKDEKDKEKVSNYNDLNRDIEIKEMFYFYVVLVVGIPGNPGEGGIGSVGNGGSEGR
jgi:hypothetical protein